MQDDLSDQVELAPDLEWLLVSVQAGAEDLLVHLVENYGVELSLLMQAVFADPFTAEDALVDALTQTVLQRGHYHSDKLVKVWLYSTALDCAWQKRRKLDPNQIRNGTAGQETRISFSLGIYLPDWLKYLPEETRLAVVLQRYLNIGRKETAQILEVSEAKIASDMGLVNEVFPFQATRARKGLDPDQSKRLLQLANCKLPANQPQVRLRRTILEMSWAIGAILLVALLTRVYDLQNPDPARRAVGIPFLTPLPTSTRVLIPTATPAVTPMKSLNGDSTTQEIYDRYIRRGQNIDTLWIDYLVMLGGAQGGPNGYTMARVELAIDFQAGKVIELVGPPKGPPEHGIYDDFNSENAYELIIDDGRLSEVKILDSSVPTHWYYLASLPLELQLDNNGTNWNFKPVEFRMLDRPVLVVDILNSNGVLENTAYLDAMTGFPLIQQRFRSKGERDNLVFYAIVNNASFDEPIPAWKFDLSPSRTIQFRDSYEPHSIGNEIMESYLSSMLKSFTGQTAGENRNNSNTPLYYEVSAMSYHRQGTKYSTNVFLGDEFIGEYPMGNPWSVQCERSPDGKRVAYIEDRRLEFGDIKPSQVLHWFPIDYPEAFETPLPNVDVTHFTFSPDSMHLAVHASTEVSLIDLLSGEIDPIMTVPSVDRLTFSEDGKYLGILQNLPQNGGATNIWIINLKTKEIVESLNLEPGQDWESQRAQIYATRQVDFTKPAYAGLENCR